MKLHAVLVASLIVSGSPLASVAEEVMVFGTRVEARPGDDPQDSFGGNLNRSVIQVSQWQEVDSTTTWSHPQPGYLNGTSTVMFVYAPLDFDNGVVVTQVCLEALDASTSVGVTLIVGAFESAGAGATPVFVPLETVTTGSTPAPGYAQLCAAVDPALTIRTSADLNGSGGPHTVQYWVGAQQSAGTLTAIGPAVVSWRRTLSQAPATATFGDVPTTHGFFRFVEALAASGITGGCGGGNYCPDSPLTRGQMAVFVATALGLYWPN